MPTENGLHQRMREVVGRRTYRSVAHLTNTNSETVRRYLQGQAPSVEFLSELCRALELNAHWLLTGKGPMLLSQSRQHALNEANPSELLTAVAEALEQLIERVDRLESYVQTLETRMRASVSATTPTTPRPLQAAEARHDSPGPKPITRASRVADALPERSPADAD